MHVQQYTHISWVSIWGELYRKSNKMHVMLAKYSRNSGKLVKIMNMNNLFSVVLSMYLLLHKDQSLSPVVQLFLLACLTALIGREAHAKQCTRSLIWITPPPLSCWMSISWTARSAVQKGYYVDDCKIIRMLQHWAEFPKSVGAQVITTWIQYLRMSKCSRWIV